MSKRPCLIPVNCKRCGRELVTRPSENSLYGKLGGICDGCLTADEKFQINMSTLDYVRGKFNELRGATHEHEN